MGIFNRKGTWVDAEAEVLEVDGLRDYAAEREERNRTATSAEGWEVGPNQAKVRARLRVLHPQRGSYEVTAELKIPNNRTFDGTVAVRVHPDDPQRVEVLWKQVEKQSSRVLGSIEEMVTQRIAEAQSAMTDPDVPDVPAIDLDQAKEMILRSWHLAPKSQRGIIEQQMTAMGMQIPGDDRSAGRG